MIKFSLFKFKFNLNFNNFFFLINLPIKSLKKFKIRSFNIKKIFKKIIGS